MPILTVDQMMAQINRNYPIKPYLYEVGIYGGSTPETDAPLDIMLNCSTVNVPGTNITFSQFKKFGIGHPHQFTMGKSFTELNLTFYETDGEPEREYFVNWQKRIYNQDTMRFGFYRDYVKTITIKQLDKKGNTTYECRVFDCFPSNISPLDKGYSNEGIAQFNVSLQFYDIKELFYDKKQGKNPFPPNVLRV